MLKTAVASAAFWVASANAVGQAIVVNSCSYDVYVYNTPASGGGFSEIDQVLSSGQTYSQTYTELSNSDGWSIKLSPSTSMANIMQYEYTFHNDGTIWYDLSDVNGNPWNGNWEITATGNCSPKQQAYQYSTDDAYGMQACPDSSSITVTLCSGTSGGSTGGASSSPAESSTWASATSAAASAASVVSSAVTSAVSSAVSSAQSPSWTHTFGEDGDKVAAAAATESNASPTTFVTSKVLTQDSGALTVTNVKTAVVTQFVTATAAPSKRHEHHPRHAHHAHF